MPEYSLFNLAVQAEAMRNSQKLYFQLVKKAKYTKLPEDYAAAKKVLEISKQQERSFDETIAEVMSANTHTLFDAEVKQ